MSNWLRFSWLFGNYVKKNACSPHVEKDFFFAGKGHGGVNVAFTKGVL